jgi:4-amino-4-deoxy-L-arabinose transferase-like glycosyltransferase
MSAIAFRPRSNRRRVLQSLHVTVSRRIPVAVWIGVIAALNAACWSVVTPAFQVSDEQSHFAYVKQLAETGELPRSSVLPFSQEEQIAMADLHFLQVLKEPGPRTIASQAEQTRLQLDLARAALLPRDGSESANVATSEPPLYYAVEAIPYLLAYHGTLLERLEWMRLVSALMAGFTALFAFLFAREALPAEPWAWTTAGLGVALAPLLGYMSGAVNPDSLLFAVSGALFFCLARVFRRGLTRRLAAATGLVIAVGVLTKLNFFGLLPGAFVGLLILSWRVARVSRLEAVRRLLIACVIAAGPAMLALAIALLAHHNVLPAASSRLLDFAQNGSIAAKLEYAWQLYLPPLPGMVSDFPDLLTTRQIWFNGFVGLYGWGDTSFPAWVYDAALIPTAAIACLFIRTIVARRMALRAHAGELCVYVLMCVGVMAMIAAESFVEFPRAGASYAHVRYLFPMLALLGALLALAARGAGRRWGPAVGVLIVMLALAQDVFSQLLVVSHYYG